MGRRAIWVPWEEQPQEAVRLAPDYSDAAFGWLATAPERNLGSLFDRWTRQGAPTLGASEHGLGWRSDAYGTNNRWTGPSATPSALAWPGVTVVAVVQTAGTNNSGDDNYAGPISWVPVGEFTGGFNLTIEWTSAGTGRPIYWRAGNNTAELSPRGYNQGVGNDYVVGDRLVIVGTFTPSTSEFALTVNRNGRVNRNTATHLSSWGTASSLISSGGYERSGHRTTQHYTAMSMVLPRTLAVQQQLSIAESPWQLFEPRREWVGVGTAGGTVDALVLAAGQLTHKPAATSTDRKLYRASTGQLVAKATAASGDRLVTLSAGARQAGPPA